MDIGILMPTMVTTGGVRRVVEIANRLVRADHNVTIYNAMNNRADWMFPINLLYIQKPYICAFHESKKDIWLCGWPRFDGKIYDTLKGRKFFMLQHWEGSWIKLLERKDWEVICFSSYAESLAKKHNDKVHKVVGGINLDIFKVNIQDQLNQKVYGKTLKILCYPRKQAKYVVWATDKMKDIELRYLGNPTVDGCHNSKHYDGMYYHSTRQNEMWDVYADADLYVSLQTKRACWNNPISEAMACGCACISTDTGSIADLKGSGGIITIPEDRKDRDGFVSQLRAKIDEFRKTKTDIIKERILANYNYVQRFGWDTIFPRLKEVFNG